MDPFHERLARVALRVAGQYGFALAGGYAIQAHGFLDRLSADVDLFAPSSVEADFSVAVDAVIQEFGRDGLVVDVEIHDASFARLSVASDSDRSKVDCSRLPAPTTRALTHCGSLKRSPRSIVCRFGYSSRMA